MNRRKFIEDAGLSMLAVCLAPTLLYCSDKKNIDLGKILGESVDQLSSASFSFKEGNNDFGYFIFEGGFINSPFMPVKVFVFYKNAVVTGFTLAVEGISKVIKMNKDISHNYGSHMINFENDFGKEYQWKTAHKDIRLSYNDYLGLPELTFYSEFLTKPL